MVCGCDTAMRKLILLSLLFAAPACWSQAWVLRAPPVGASSPTANVTVTFGAGDFIKANCNELHSSSPTTLVITSSKIADTITTDPSCTFQNVQNGESMRISWIRSATGGSTTITCTGDGLGDTLLSVEDYSTHPVFPTLDACVNNNTSGTGFGDPITLVTTGTNDLLGVWHNSPNPGGTTYTSGWTIPWCWVTCPGDLPTAGWVLWTSTTSNSPGTQTFSSDWNTTFEGRIMSAFMQGTAPVTNIPRRSPTMF